MRLPLILLVAWCAAVPAQAQTVVTAAQPYVIDRDVTQPLTIRSTGGFTGPVVTVRNWLPMENVTGVPPRRVIRDLRIECNGPYASPYQYGLMIQGANIRIERLTVLNCYIGVVLQLAVDVSIRDCLLTRNFTNIYAPGSGRATVTTTRFQDCNIREAYANGILIQNAIQLTFQDCIIESNRGTGLIVAPGVIPDAYIDQVACVSCWFENNAGGHYAGPVRVDHTNWLARDR